MAGFLDRNNRIVDMILTGYGRSLLSQGKLRFVSWAPFDDEVQYDPVISASGTLTAEELSASIVSQIQTTPIREATTGFKKFDAQGLDETNGSSRVFTVPHGQQKVLPVLSTGSVASELDIGINQRKVSQLMVKKDMNGVIVERVGPYDIGFEKLDGAVYHVSPGFAKDMFPSDYHLDGYTVQVFVSSSDGYRQVNPKFDSKHDLVFNGEIVITLED